jgi:hypothetical protein
MSNYRKLNLYLTERHQQALQSVYEQMRAEGLPCEYGGKMNASAVILYALEQQLRRHSKTTPANH